MESCTPQNAVLAQVSQFWSMLDEMAQNNAEEYKRFIERQMRDSAEYFSPPEPHSCLRTSVGLQPHDGTLYLNMCGWKRVPAPTSPAQPVPVWGGELERGSQRKENYHIVDVAFNPEVLQRAEKNPQEKEQIHLLALNFIQKQHKLSLSQHFTVMKAKLKGTVQDMKRRLMSRHQTKTRAPDQDNPQTKPAQSLLQQICSLRMEEDREESSIQLSLGQEDKDKARPGLIEVISSTEFVQPQQPKHQMTVCSLSSDSDRRIKLCVELPGINSVSQCQLSISQDDIVLEVEKMYFLHLRFPEQVNEETCLAKFNKKKHILTFSASVL
ncbi:PIH1 domain-containing protein 2 [Neoarius graeffei]|uniref:PIH1 domain-containing protein 2 n=1 Tax=Neoarius graeffei TaxID=443677 RepID=UPI00298C33CE|nr:PIH1 domain-containing protein 2 [Neoarius graeffei]